MCLLIFNQIFYLASHQFILTFIPSLSYLYIRRRWAFLCVCVLLHGDDTFPIDDVFPRDEKAYNDEIIRAVGDAIEAGYRHFDGASFYANEVEVGQAIRQKMDDAIIDRKDLFIVSKVNREIIYLGHGCICCLRVFLYFLCGNRGKRADLLLFRNDRR